jgi:hypothetical protein
MTRIRVRHGEDEIELDGPEEFIDKHLKKFFERIGKDVSPTIKEALLKSPQKGKEEIPAPAEFYKSKGKTDGISQILIFGKYLEEYRDIPEFSRGDVNKLASEAKLAKDIHSQYFTNAVKQGLLRLQPGGKYSLTLSAEEVMASM